MSAIPSDKNAYLVKQNDINKRTMLPQYALHRQPGPLSDEAPNCNAFRQRSLSHCSALPNIISNFPFSISLSPWIDCRSADPQSIFFNGSNLLISDVVQRTYHSNGGFWYGGGCTAQIKQHFWNQLIDGALAESRR